MKKIASLLLMICMSVSLTACGNRQEESISNSTDTLAESEVPETLTTETDNAGTEVSNTEAVIGTEETKTETTEVIETGVTETEVTEAEAAKADQQTETTTKTLVVYFSATGNTKAIANNIANGLSADIYEIVPETPYTDADLDYGDNNSRSTIEMNDPSVRPVISGSVANMGQYDTIYIGYPIWWGEAPRILDTFVESYDFTNKTVIPFCTSASSGVGSSASDLAKVAGTGNWLSGQRFSGSESQDKVMEWVNGLGL